jgi:voltage-gated sodium channel
MGIVRPVMEAYPYAWAFFVPFILITTFAVANLVVGLIVNSMQDVVEEDEAAADERHEILDALRRLDERLARIEERDRQP